MAGLREFFESTAGRLVAVALLIVGLGVAFFVFRNSFGAPAEILAANDRVFIDTATGESFTMELKSGMKVPVHAPSGKDTGYPAELCYWTKDGKTRNKPYPVLLNTWVGKSGPTFCKDCGRLVVAHNPRPGPGVSPPPTEAEYQATRKTNQER
jgi:hypothetical protein